MQAGQGRTRHVSHPGLRHRVVESHPPPQSNQGGQSPRLVEIGSSLQQTSTVSTSPTKVPSGVLAKHHDGGWVSGYSDGNDASAGKGKAGVSALEKERKAQGRLDLGESWGQPAARGRSRPRSRTEALGSPLPEVPKGSYRLARGRQDDSRSHRPRVRHKDSLLATGGSGVARVNEISGVVRGGLPAEP